MSNDNELEELIGDFAKEQYDQGFTDKVHDDIDYERLEEIVTLIRKREAKLVLEARWVLRFGEDDGDVWDTEPIEATTPDEAYSIWRSTHPHGSVERLSDFYVDKKGVMFDFMSEEYRTNLSNREDKG